MNIHSLVSIIIPTFNRALLISETLDSILSQSYTAWECIIVDDGSTDNTEELILEYCKGDERFQYYKRPNYKPKGANSCRNYGLELSNGVYVNWFDSDDIMHPDKLKLQVQALEASHYHFCVCQSLVFEESIDNILGLRSKRILSDQPFEDFLKKKIIWLTQAPLFKKDFLIVNQYRFDEELHAGQEWELFTRILFDYSSYHIIEQPLVFLRSHSKSISGTKSTTEKWHYTLARFKIYKRFKSSLSISSKSYLQNYFLRMYREFLREHKLKNAFFIWKNFIIFEQTFTYRQRIKMTIALISFGILKKGDVFLIKV